MTPAQFISQLRSLELDHTFNPYSERCTVYDAENAPEMRRDGLLKILRCALEVSLDSIWIGRDLGHRGGRRTGLAFTDDCHLNTHARRWRIEIERPTVGDEVSERTATVVWSALRKFESHVFLWNVFPLHPHLAELPFSNRAHNVDERNIGIDLLVELIDLLQPGRLVPIGKDAAAVANRICGKREVLPVRHPSFGGQRTFLEQLAQVNELTHG